MIALTTNFARPSGDGLCRGSCALRCSRAAAASFVMLGGVHTTPGEAADTVRLGIVAGGDCCADSAADVAACRPGDAAC